MDPAKVLDHLSNVLTVDEWREFTQTEDYLWMCARAEKYQGKAMDELVKRGTKKRQEAWKIALEMAESIVREDLKESSVNIPEEQRRRVEQQLAEHLLVEQDITPPTYRFWADCAQCGRVLVPEQGDEILASCPWCTK